MASMKGGFNNPPNGVDVAPQHGERDASMKGGFNNPPNLVQLPQSPGDRYASMKGGFNNPPNPSDQQRHRSTPRCFNEGGVQ